MAQEPILVMSSGSAEPGLDVVAAVFTKATGTPVKIVYNNSVEDFDVVVASTGLLERKLRPSGAVAGPGELIGSMGLGVGIAAGRRRPDLATVDTLAASIRAADSIVITENHSSGLYVEELLERIGMRADVEARVVRRPNGPGVMDRLLEGHGDDLGFLSVNEFHTYAERGIEFIGTLPEAVQLRRDFFAVAASDTPRRGPAGAFVHFCGGPGRSIMQTHGFD